MYKPLSLHAFLLCLLSFLTFNSFANDSQLLLEYQREFSLIAETDNSVDIQLFADGTVDVHYPFFMRLSGDYRYQLSRSEIDTILNNLQQLGIDQFDATGAKQALFLEQQAALEAAQLPGQSVTVITDPEITHIRISDLSSFSKSNNDQHEFSFVGARNEAGLYPQVTMLSDLTAALDILDELVIDTRMQRIEVSQ